MKARRVLIALVPLVLAPGLTDPTAWASLSGTLIESLDRMRPTTEPPPRPRVPVAVGVHARVRPDQLEATIRPTSRRIRVGDAPSFEVRIRNRGSEPVWLVRSVDASDAWASPRVTIDIEGPNQGYVVPRLLRCGTNNGVRSEDFAEVPAGGEFDPFSGGWLPGHLARGKFTQPGRYRASFRYVTAETDPRPWAAGPCNDCQLHSEVRERLAQVPAVDLLATVDFEVRR